jgi:hypothetical protein
MSGVWTPKEYFDSVRPARVAAVSGLGFTERQAGFLVTVMVHSGVFLERQYCAFAGISHGQKAHDFVSKLIARRFATAIAPGRRHQGRLFHVHYKPLYEAIGEPDNRHRKTVSLGRMIERLMILDGVLADRDYMWLGTERDKRDYFDRTLDVKYFRPTDYPHVSYRADGGETTRYFPDKLPIGIEKHGFQRHVFLYLVTRDVPVDFRQFLLRHGELLRTVPQFTVRLLIPVPQGDEPLSVCVSRRARNARRPDHGRGAASVFSAPPAGARTLDGTGWRGPPEGVPEVRRSTVQGAVSLVATPRRSGHMGGPVSRFARRDGVRQRPTRMRRALPSISAAHLPGWCRVSAVQGAERRDDLQRCEVVPPDACAVQPSARVGGSPPW